ncbi:DUF262 domain-containing protein [Pediococcus pentosaceus]|uniref:DUF262 domain-containing protein n=1 Tax=Pediococcus pentosaceus TaxID=1255 RepID=UPI0018A191DD|nr:DUF262 domain-containing protein [Pediococcus pentosaceus]MBF7108741.1 DUF262 domain-containing protein [Pediococcus pentosaceus]
MSTSIEVNKQNVKALLESGKERPFIIPEYQRPYAWTVDQVQTLFDDLVEYTADHHVSDSNQNKEAYFLGCIVSFENKNHEQEIIDGQQRLTTLFLLLRAVYSKLDSSQPSKEANNFKQAIEPTIWQQNKLTGEVDFNHPLMTSRAINDEGNNIFYDILKNGRADHESNNNYSKNYLLLQELLDNYAKEQTLTFYDLIFNILNQTIMLPIEADSQDTALTIFSTLNDRGLPLSDADIFKAKIYNHVSDKKVFVEKWQELEERADYAGESIQKLFYYYMFYLRASENDRKATTPGIRKYYSKNNFYRLFADDLLDQLDQLLNIWVVVSNHQIIEGEDWSQDVDILKVLDILSSFPNEFWKYPVVVFYLKNHKKDDFKNIFLIFLHHFFAVIAAHYVITPTINAIKGNIINLNASICNDLEPKFLFKNVDTEELRTKIKNPHRNTVRMLLKLIAYKEQDNLLPEKWEIEHILPQKWQSTYFPNNSEAEVKEKVEHIGNKIPFEKKLNIIASNGYLDKKKEQYRQSKITITKDLADSSAHEWKLDEISDRDAHLSDSIIDILKKWGLNRVSDSVDFKKQPSRVDLEKIKQFKEKGWI